MSRLQATASVCDGKADISNRSFKSTVCSRHRKDWERADSTPARLIVLRAAVDTENNHLTLPQLVIDATWVGRQYEPGFSERRLSCGKSARLSIAA
jgi:hypothetical protein